MVHALFKQRALGRPVVKLQLQVGCGSTGAPAAASAVYGPDMTGNGNDTLKYMQL